MHQIDGHIYSNEQIIHINRIFHDIEADTYDILYAPLISEEGQHWRYLLDYALPLLSQIEPKTFIDFGCGTGLVSSVLIHYLNPVDKLICIDLSTKMLHKASTKLKNIKAGQHQQKDYTIDYLCADTIPLFHEQITLIAMNSVLHHLPDPRKTIEQFGRLLQRDGLMMFAHEPNRRAYNNYLIRGLSKGRAKIRSNITRINNPEKPIPSLQYTDLVAEEVNKIDLLPWTVTSDEIVQIANIQVPHENKPDKKILGFDMEEIRSWLPGFNLIYWSSKGYLGTYASPKRSVQLVEYLLSKIYPMDGRLLTTIFQKQ